MTVPSQLDAEGAAAELSRLKSKMLMKSYFVMFRTILAAEKLQTVMLEHYRWIIGLEKDNRVLGSGPLFEREGGPGLGMTIFKARDFDEACALAASDPFYTSGAVSFRVCRWQINEGRVSATVDFSDGTFAIS